MLKHYIQAVLVLVFVMTDDSDAERQEVSSDVRQPSCCQVRGKDLHEHGCPEWTNMIWIIRSL